ncbi:hypothetical protein AK812_SmicGene8253 [Symbiodinium microadriaticum]|uniref:Uncharacterized protein n=1 Tax=Symbiodinium microadriaticum TaxID=2951 RepID=A0A1Q9ELF5_SYMMI|nr:hypothetical protein AK812_SmicGene8253 [Symbiodinium microadriaticum]
MDRWTLPLTKTTAFHGDVFRDAGAFTCVNVCDILNITEQLEQYASTSVTFEQIFAVLMFVKGRAADKVIRCGEAAFAFHADIYIVLQLARLPQNPPLEHLGTLPAKNHHTHRRASPLQMPDAIGQTGPQPSRVPAHS